MTGNERFTLSVENYLDDLKKSRDRQEGDEWVRYLTKNPNIRKMVVKTNKLDKKITINIVPK